MLRFPVLGLALLVDAPVLWSSFITQTTTVEAALVRLLITIPIVAVLFALVRIAIGQPLSQAEAEPEPPAGFPLN